MYVRPSLSQSGTRGYSLVEVIMVLVIATIFAAIAIPTYRSVSTEMQLNSMANAIVSAVSQTRYAAVWKSQIYTLAISAPTNTYVVTNVSTNTAAPAVPLPSQSILINGGASATYTYTMCPNGTIYGAGGACPGNANPPALSVTYQARQTNVSVSGVGNVTTTAIN